jgi:predicted DNA-binding transcriptional regulator AlpA
MRRLQTSASRPWEGVAVKRRPKNSPRITASGSTPEGEISATNGSPTSDPDALLTERQAAELLGFTARSLQAWRYRGDGPQYVRVGARGIRYRRQDLQEWIKAHLQNSTSAEREN